MAVFLWIAIVILLPTSKSEEQRGLVADGQRLKLECFINVDDFKIVEWLKNGKEFCRFHRKKIKALHFRYRSNQVNHTRIYCDATKAVLEELNLTSSGLYTCQTISMATDAVNIVTRSAPALVYPTYGPTITGLKARYWEGERIEANCTAAPSNPPPLLLWYINGITAEGWSTTTYPCLITKEGLCILRSSLKLEASRNYFPRGLASFVCESTVLALPSRRASLTASLLTTSYQAGTTKSSDPPNRIVIVLCFIIYLGHILP